MGLLSGLEKFGLGQDGDLDITKDEKSAKKGGAIKKGTVAQVVEEKDLVLDKVVQCPVCDKKFHTLTVKTGKAKRMEPDPDLRPNFQGIDTVKYDVVLCPNCGYAAMPKDFVHLTTGQMKWIRQQISEKFTPLKDEVKETYTYDEAVDRFKLALVSTMVKKGKMSEKAYICLKIAWLRRSQYETIKDNTPENLKKKEEVKKEWDGFYRQAYDGFVKASETEMPPYCGGMDSNTLEFMLANMAMYFKDYGAASKLVSRLLTSPNSNQRVKDKCLDLKEQITAGVKEQQGK